MDAWETLLNNSSLASGDAWALLTHPSQSGGGDVIYVGCGVILEVSDSGVDIVLTEAIEVDVLVVDVALTPVSQADILSAGNNIDIGTCHE